VTSKQADQPGEPARKGSRGRVRIVDVAAQAGVSRSAASFVMSGRTDQRISEETARKVRKAAAELGYRPSITAQTLRTGSSGTVALVSDFVSTTGHANALILGALEALGEHDILLYTVETLGDRERELKLIHNLLDRQVDGFIYASMFTREVEVPPVLFERPLVLLNCVAADGAQIPTALADEIGAGAAAAHELLVAGHRDRIHFIGDFPDGVRGGAQWGGWESLALRERFAGITQELTAAGTQLVGTSHIRDWTIDEGLRAGLEVLSQSRPSAVICINDEVALGVYRAARQCGLQVPDDLSVVAFDDGVLARAAEPRLASFGLAQRELGRAAAGLLLDPQASPQPRLVPMPLGCRDSIAAPAVS
jgi:LacI family transcriptional regulator